MKKACFIVFLTVVLLSSLYAEEMYFPDEDFIIRLPLEGDWDEVESREVGSYTVYSTEMGDITLELYFTGEVITPLQHLEFFLNGKAPFTSDSEVEQSGEPFAIYTKQVYDMYLAEMYSYYAVSGIRSVDGEERYFFTRFFFPDYYGVVVIASVPAEDWEEYEFQLREILDF